MRDLFAILAIILALVGLDVFQVPDEDALVASGIRAEAQAALADSRHPLTVAVEQRRITVSGRVESDAARRAVVDRLAALQGVDEVRDDLLVLPQVTPFRLTLEKGEQGLAAAGHLPDAALQARLAALLGQDVDLPFAAGVPDDAWSGLAMAGARALTRMLDGRFALQDRAVRLEGRVHLPADQAWVAALFADLPEGYTASVDVQSVDDGTPYRLSITRDPLMGLRITGKLPPGFDRAALAVLGAPQDLALTEAPLPLDQPGFAPAVRAALPVFALLAEGVLAVSPGVVTLTGGPVDAEAAGALEGLQDALRARLPEGYALQTALVPGDTGAPLHLTVDWDGARAVARGRVPADVVLDGIVDQALDRSPYPDLRDWSAPLSGGLDGLTRLARGTLTYDAEGLRIEGVVAGPDVARAVREIAGPAVDLDLTLMDDGTPAAFELRFDAVTGAHVAGKLPPGLSMQDMATALDLPEIAGGVTVAPEGAGGDAVLNGLSALAPWLPIVETMTVRFADGSATWDIRTTQGASAPEIGATLPDRMQVREAAPVPVGTTRTHLLRNEAQVSTAGLWLPDLGAAPDAARCATLLRDQPEMGFETGRLTLSALETRPLARLTAVARACTRHADLTLVIDVEAGGGAAPILDRQRARRRAEGLRALLISRGVPEGQIIATGAAADGDALRFGWD